MTKEERQFVGQCVWGLHQDFYRDRKGGPEWFRLWSELSDEERERFVFIGEAMTNYFRKAEGNDTLRGDLEALRKQYESVLTRDRKEWKDNGGR